MLSGDQPLRLCSVHSLPMITFLATATLQRSGKLAVGSIEAIDTLRQSSQFADIRLAAQTAFEELPSSADFGDSQAVDLAS